MKRFRYGILALVVFVSSVLTGCAGVAGAPTAEVTSGGGPTIQESRSESYKGPKARIAVNKFINKSARGGRAFGEGMSDMMTTALFNSNRFIVLDRTDHGDIMAEQDLGASGRIKQETAAPIGQMEGAELLITGAVTAFHPNAKGGMGGIGVPAGGGFLGIGGGGKQAYMTIDVKVVDTKTGRIVSAATVEGKSTDYKAGVGGILGGAPLALGLLGYENTPAEQAIRVCIEKAVEYISRQAPASYFRH